MTLAKKEENKGRGMLANLLFNIIIPAVILTKLSKPEYLGPVYALITALAFPLFYGLYDFIVLKKSNFISILGFVSILLTGIIGLLQIPAEWIAIKEASIPLVIGIVILVSYYTPFPIVRKLLYNDEILDIERIDSILTERNLKSSFDKMISRASIWLALSFFVSAALNYILAKIMIQSAPGTPQFNEELGRMAVMSYPVIALPSTIITGFIFWHIFKSIKKLTQLSTNEILAEKLREK